MQSDPDDIGDMGTGSPNERLRHARQAAGFDTATDAAKAFGWVVPTYLSHENGTRGFPKGKLSTYAKAFRVSAEWLLTGRAQRKLVETVPVVGYVVTGGIVADDGGYKEVAEAPPERGLSTVCVKVRGDAMYPAYSDGDGLYYESVDVVVAEAVGRECVVGMPDGTRMVRRVAAGSQADLYTLLAYNAPPLMDVALSWASPIKWVSKG